MEDRNDKDCEYKGSGGVSLWDLLTFYPFCIAPVGAYRKGIYFWPSLIMGFIIGVTCVCFIRVLGNFVVKFIIGKRLNNNTKYENLILRLLYLFTFIWIVISGTLGYLGMKFILVPML